MHGLYVVELHNCVHMQGILLLNGICLVKIPSSDKKQQTTSLNKFGCTLGYQGVSS
jgi:hypothetical protein